MKKINLTKKFLSLVIFCALIFLAGGHSESTAAPKTSAKNFYRGLSQKLSKNRADYPELSDYEFANFRAVTVTGIAPGILYRSSSPVKPWGNRNLIADSASRAVGIKSFINLADESKNLQGYKNFADSYYSTQKIICLGLNLKFKSKKFEEGVAQAVRFIANNSGPYLIHCDLGKDRCGIVCAILESLAGASPEEIVTDYLISFYNYFGIKPGSSDYEFVADNEIRPFLASIFEIKNIYEVNLAAAARRYLLRIGLSEQEIELAIKNLSTEKNF